MIDSLPLLEPTPAEFKGAQTIGERYSEADPIYLGMAIALVYDRRRREEEGTKRSKGDGVYGDRRVENACGD